jgi:cellulose synthase/poly-beta-1,6-N-acetylglucosamine synthase-like glycosyltransferase
MLVAKITGWILFYFINAIVAFYFLLPVLLFVISHFKKKSFKNAAFLQTPLQTDTDFAAIVTSHQDTRFIPPLIDSFIKQSYSNFKLYIVADDCNSDHLVYNDDRIVILKPKQALHSKIKSINYAIDNFISNHQVMVIFDSDNLVHPDYFKKLDRYFKMGFKVIQTHMLSKNIDSTFARLDSVGHIYYTFTERKVKMNLGMHSAILGLGIAIDTDLYKEIRYKDTIGGFDKKLQSQLAIKVNQIAFAEDAIVYDEKIEEGDALEKQRTRWIYTYFKHFKDSWNLFKSGLKSLSMGRILLGTSMLRPPMFLLIFSAFLIICISAFVKPLFCFIWIAMMILYSLNFSLIIATQSSQKGMLKSLVYIPLLIIRQLKSLIKIKDAKSAFLKTEHKKIIYIDELLKNELS